ncbi:MAG: TetR/AcrR family transcriptional regulator [Solobacterium sp.]|nr:TetR/AcrR family transcriptional regulator [Solobacterium sp.]
MPENTKITRTKHRLSKALLHLLAEKPITAVSIRELCETAGINRTTFYNHYGSQYDLLNDIRSRFLDDVAECLAAADPANSESIQERVTTVFSYIKDNSELSYLLLNNGIDPEFAEQLFSLPKITDLLAAALLNCHDPMRRQAVTDFAVHGSFRLLQNWINSGCERSPAEEAELILELARRVCI